MKRIAIIALLSACATSQERARVGAVIQKATVDGLGQAYLGYCEVVRKPACIEADAAASQVGTPQTKEDRVACLRPCDSATATKIQTAVDIVRTEQTLLFELLRGDATAEELSEQRSQLRRAADHLIGLMESTGAMDLLQRAVE